ncbi:MAG: ABC transporter substrate binding protein [Acidobacteriota bacterium]
MKRNLFFIVLVLIFAQIFTLSLYGQGVFIVQKKDVASYEEVKNNFIQFSFVEQIPNLNTSPYYLDESAKDSEVLNSIAEKKPSIVFAIGSYAAKKVREAMPDVLIVAAMIYYPDAEKFSPNEKTVLIASLGSAKDLMEQIKKFRKIKKVGILHNSQISDSANLYISDLKSAGVEVADFSFTSKDEIQAIFQEVKGQIQALLVLPDSVTLNSDVIRYIVTECISADILPLSLSDRMVSSGFFFSSYFSTESIGKTAAKVVKEVASSGKVPSDKIRFPSDSESSMNKGTLNAFKLKIPSGIKIGVIYE